MSGRDAGAVADELAVDDLAVTRYIGASVDIPAKAVTASALGLITRRAAYRGATGCAVTFDGGPPDGIDAVPGAIRSDESLTRATNARLTPILEQAFAEPDPSRLRRTRAVVVVHNGRVAGERYAAGILAGTPLLGWSMTKSVTSALAGILVGEGRLALERPVPVPEWQAPNDSRRLITLDHLLRMRSGLEFDEDATGPFSDAIRMLLGVRDMAGYALDKKLMADPGTHWHYSSGTSLIIARVIRNVMRDDREYQAFPRRSLFDPIGMSSAVLETDGSGTFVGSSLMYATARDWARFGMLYLQDGVWDGKRILPEGWVAYTRAAAPDDPEARYGAHFWLRVPDGYHGSGAPLPADAFHAAGHQGQFVTIVPSRQAVVVRLGGTRYADAWDQAAFVRDVLAALAAP